jgi:predicted RNA-binding protein
MCEANAYFVKNGDLELIMESVDQLTPEGDNTWHLVGIFGDQKYVKGRIQGMQLVEHKIFFEEVADSPV